MNRRGVLIGAGIGFVALLAWYFLLFAPVNSDVKKAEDNVSAAQTDETSKRSELQRLQSEKLQAGTAEDSARRLDQLVPASAELAAFIDNANTIAIRSGIDFLSISPTPPSVGNGVAGALTITMSMQIEGTFYDLLKYLDALQDPDQMPRLLVVDSINISAKSDSVNFAGQSPTLAVTLSARMFMQPAGASTTPGTNVPGTTVPGATSAGTPATGSSGTGTSGTGAATTPTNGTSNTAPNTGPITSPGPSTSAPSTAIQ